MNEINNTSTLTKQEEDAKYPSKVVIIFKSGANQTITVNSTSNNTFDDLDVAYYNYLTKGSPTFVRSFDNFGRVFYYLNFADIVSLSIHY